MGFFERRALGFLFPLCDDAQSKAVYSARMPSPPKQIRQVLFHKFLFQQSHSLPSSETQVKYVNTTAAIAICQMSGTVALCFNPPNTDKIINDMLLLQCEC